MISNTRTVNAKVVRRGIILVFPVAWQRGPRRAATIVAVALSRAVAWRADSAVIAEIVPRLKCFLKQRARDYIN
jgi:hypothetical protein